MSKTLLVIDGLDVSHLVKYDVLYSKLYGPKTGRDSNGDNHIDLVGIFNTVQVTTGDISESELSNLLSVLNRVVLTVSFYDPEHRAMINNVSMYVNDFTASLKRYRINPKYNKFSFDLIANHKRGR